MTRSRAMAGRARPSPPSWLPVAAALTTVLLWASAFVAIRHVGREISAGPLALGRLLVGSALLGAFAAFRPHRWPTGAISPLLVRRTVWPATLRSMRPSGDRRRYCCDGHQRGPLLLCIACGVVSARFRASSCSAAQRLRVRTDQRCLIHSAQGVGVLLCVWPRLATRPPW
jgi:hypothetical protein